MKERPEAPALELEQKQTPSSTAAKAKAAAAAAEAAAAAAALAAALEASAAAAAAKEKEAKRPPAPGTDVNRPPPSSQTKRQEAVAAAVPAVKRRRRGQLRIRRELPLAAEWAASHPYVSVLPSLLNGLTGYTLGMYPRLCVTVRALYHCAALANCTHTINVQCSWSLNRCRGAQGG